MWNPSAALLHLLMGLTRFLKLHALVWWGASHWLETACPAHPLITGPPPGHLRQHWFTLANVAIIRMNDACKPSKVQQTKVQPPELLVNRCVQRTNHHWPPPANEVQVMTSDPLHSYTLISQRTDKLRLGHFLISRSISLCASQNRMKRISTMKIIWKEIF